MPLGLAPEIAARVPYLLMLAGTLVATWYAVYHLARDPSAQPVAFAFGGEAEPRGLRARPGRRQPAGAGRHAGAGAVLARNHAGAGATVLRHRWCSTGWRRCRRAAAGPVHRAPRRLAGADAVGRTRHGDDLRRPELLALALPGPHSCAVAPRAARLAAVAGAGGLVPGTGAGA
jgi:hypothetical protein